ncbi:hypothetical protein [Mameliella sediminis]|uniref:hypothetical protein n=1 Tax=Mameliella sediminis TaxID=2836866 RepID=UPI001C482C1B|nr:hypothetical protein [Mameliella sediminis]MBY6116244.1 hypothetical protein [Antarctobacter heliothermus]MBY6146209.1 hypothetical protein [Mameliella alba]MBV7396998.1 hypothetical protein [Mameliella sediminis]MBY6161866.1 hypothetical protein [Mameliella alba]MBY6170336.1 hypothetical protein [Mameliella alba]
MLIRALILLLVFVALSGAATWYFGHEVLIALGLILTQAKILLKKLAGVELGAVLLWLKTQGAMFFRVEIIKKWITTTVVPIMLGKAILRRIQLLVKGYLAIIQRHYARLMAWFNGLSRMERAVAWLVILFATLALSVTSLGLWLVLFSVQLPLWLVAALSATIKMTSKSLEKMVFKAVAFLQLAWLWKFIRRFLPERFLEWKRRTEFRIARQIVRRRRMTLKQLVERKGRLPFKLGLLAEYLFHPPGRTPR